MNMNASSEMKLALGTVQFGLDYGVSNDGGKTSNNEIAKILAYAKQHHITTLDTSCSYGDAEAKIGQFSGPANNFSIITKTPSTIHKNPSLIKETFYKSLNYLKQDSLYGVLVHNCDDLLKPNGKYIYQTLETLKSENLIEKIGVSVYSKQQLEQVFTYFDVDIVQLPFNILDQRLLLDGTLAQLKQKNIEIHARSVFLQGLLLMPIDKLPRYFLPYYQLLQAVKQLAKEKNISPLELTLDFVNGITEIDKIVCGINNLNHLKQLFSASNQKITAATVKHLATWDENLISPINWPN